jgi:5'-nucleotidase
MQQTKLLNINIPHPSLGPIRGMKICRQSEGRWEEEFVEGEDPRGQKFYWLTGNFSSRDTGPGTDINALREGYISIVPSSHDLTHHLAIPDLRSLEDVTPIA